MQPIMASKCRLLPKVEAFHQFGNLRDVTILTEAQPKSFNEFWKWWKAETKGFYHGKYAFI